MLQLLLGWQALALALCFGGGAGVRVHPLQPLMAVAVHDSPAVAEAGGCSFSVQLMRALCSCHGLLCIWHGQRSAALAVLRANTRALLCAIPASQALQLSAELQINEVTAVELLITAAEGRGSFTAEAVGAAVVSDREGVALAEQCDLPMAQALRADRLTGQK